MSKPTSQHQTVKVTVLGCGSSGGVPLITGDWGRCDPQDSRNRRRRPSVLVETNGKTILVDTGPDMREQFLTWGPPERIDAVILTHYHADHLNGIDDIRHFVGKQNQTIPVYVLPEVGDHLRAHFNYVVKGFAWYPPLIDIRPVEPGTGVLGIDVDGVAVDIWRQNHGRLDTIGMRFGPFAYSTDCVDLSDAILAQLRQWKLKLWMADAARIKPHPAHAHLDMTLDWMQRVKPEQGLLTHMSEGLDYADTLAACPDFVQPAYDGMEITVET